MGGALLQKFGYKATPSTEFPVPPPDVRNPYATGPCGNNEENQAMESDEETFCAGYMKKLHYFCGSSFYTLKQAQHVLDAVQLECCVKWTKDPVAWQPFAQAI